MNNKEHPYSVADITAMIKEHLEGEKSFKRIFVKGEISNFSQKNGHLYFTLKDEKAAISCIMLRSYASRLKFTPENGSKVLTYSDVTFYQAYGKTQLNVLAMQNDGIGDLYRQFEALKKKLEAEGLFSELHKKPIPRYPFDIAIVSAQNGAAIQDVFTTIRRRWPVAMITLYPSLVQGQNAANDLKKNLLAADEQHHDVILLVRGGGGIEDLWCFNDESLARTVYALKTPIITGVGHETDFTLVDFVSDKRAATPTAAAEIVSAELDSTLQQLEQTRASLVKSIHLHLQTARHDLDQNAHHPVYTREDYLLYDARMQLAMREQSLYDFEHTINRIRQSFDLQKTNLAATKFIQTAHTQIKQQEYLLANAVDKMCLSQRFTLENKENAFQDAMRQAIEDEKSKLSNLTQLLQAYSPYEIFKRGYSVTLKDGKPLKSIEDIRTEETITVRLTDGHLKAVVLEKERN